MSSSTLLFFKKWFLISSFCLISVTNVYAQVFINGTVINEYSERIPAATVQVKSTPIRTITDANGNFALQVPDSASTLLTTARGYILHQTKINRGTSFTIQLTIDATFPGEKVYVGYGTQSKQTVAGAIATVRGDELSQSPVLALSNTLAGRLPGIIVINRSGEPGNDGASLYIRGNNALGDESALIVIDGVLERMGGLDRINPIDIETISVLKDASAAIYGWRAANGVIMVTTKKGKIGKPSLSYSFDQGFTNPTVIPKVTNASQYAHLLNELNIYQLPVSEWEAAHQAYRSTGSYLRPNGSVRSAPFSPEDLAKYQSGSAPWSHPNTDWFEATLKNFSPQVRHSLRLHGGTERFHYLASVGYLNQDGNYINSATSYKQYDARLNLNFEVNKYIKINVGTLGRQEVRNTSIRPASSIFRTLQLALPHEHAYWPNGLPGIALRSEHNPVVISTKLPGYHRSIQNFVQTNTSFEISVPRLNGLKFISMAALDQYTEAIRLWENPWTVYTRGNGFETDGITPRLLATSYGPNEPRMTPGSTKQLNLFLEGVLSYHKSFRNHTLYLLVGTNRETTKSDHQYNTARERLSTSRLGHLGRIEYNFSRKYLAEFVWRYDGSFMFPKEERYRFFPGFLAGWVISEENFWKRTVPVVHFLKLRGSVGQLGNDQINMPISTPNNTYRYLATTSSNLGLEGLILANKIHFEFDVFSNQRTKFIWDSQGNILRLPVEYLGKLQDKGWDLKLGYLHQSTHLQYRLSANAGQVRNKIITWNLPFHVQTWPIGMPFSSYFVYEYDGVFKTQAEIDANPLNYSALTNQLRPGDMKFRDTNGDGKITPEDRIFLPNSNLPLFQGGINASIQYKNIDLVLLVQGAAGAKQFVSSVESGISSNYLLDTFENRWTIDHPSSVHPRITNRGDQYYSVGNTYWLRSSNYLRLKNFELGYSLPTRAIGKIGLKSTRLHVSGFNLFTIDKLKVLDPEADNNLGYYYPQQKIFNMGLSASL